MLVDWMKAKKIHVGYTSTKKFGAAIEDINVIIISCPFGLLYKLSLFKSEG